MGRSLARNRRPESDTSRPTPSPRVQAWERQAVQVSATVGSRGGRVCAFPRLADRDGSSKRWYRRCAARCDGIGRRLPTRCESNRPKRSAGEREGPRKGRERRSLATSRPTRRNRDESSIDRSPSRRSSSARSTSARLPVLRFSTRDKPLAWSWSLSEKASRRLRLREVRQDERGGLKGSTRFPARRRSRAISAKERRFPVESRASPPDRPRRLGDHRSESFAVPPPVRRIGDEDAPKSRATSSSSRRPRHRRFGRNR